jgi:hypothetical protein
MLRAGPLAKLARRSRHGAYGIASDAQNNLWFIPANLNQANAVFHLHGSLLDPAGMMIPQEITSCGMPMTVTRTTLTAHGWFWPDPDEPITVKRAGYWGQAEVTAARLKRRVCPGAAVGGQSIFSTPAQ